jgi:tripartite-type tricarboxylate transporter receptor subunit TctC
MTRISRPFSALRRACLAAVVGTACLASGAFAQAWPTQPVKWIIPYPAGGATDTLSRILAREVEKKLGQPVVVENRAGGSTFIAVQALLSSRPDGYTMMVTSNDTLTINPHLMKTPYDAEQSFDFAGMYGEYIPSLLVAKKDFPASNAREAFDYIRKNPKAVNYASHGTGSVSQIRMELLLAKLGVKVNHVPYKGSAPALQDIAGGQVDLLVDSRVNAMPLVRTGNVKVIAVLGRERYADLPNVMTAAEAGAAGGDFGTFQGFLVPKGTPATVIKTFSDALRAALDNAELRASLLERGFKAGYTSPADFRALALEGSQVMKKVIADNGITVSN